MASQNSKFSYDPKRGAAEALEAPAVDPTWIGSFGLKFGPMAAIKLLSQIGAMDAVSPAMKEISPYLIGPVKGIDKDLNDLWEHAQSSRYYKSPIPRTITKSYERAKGQNWNDMARAAYPTDEELVSAMKSGALLRMKPPSTATNLKRTLSMILDAFKSDTPELMP